MPSLSPPHRRRAVATGALAAVGALLAGLALATPAAAAPEPKTEEIQLLGINDFHGNLAPPAGTYFGVTPVGGAAYLASQLEALRGQTSGGSLTVAAGDLVGASPLTSALFHDEPTIDALDLMKLDVAAVGNHEFDEGATELLRLQNGGCHPVDGCQDGDGFDGAQFPYLAANVVDTATGRTLLPPYAIKNVKGVKVGFIGMTLEGTPQIVSSDGVKGLEFRDEVATANALVPELRRQNVETIVVLLHEGGSTAASGGVDGCTNLTGPITDIAAGLDPAIDVVVSGHTHQAYNCRVAGKLVTSAGSFGRAVTDIRLSVAKQSKDVVGSTARNLIIDDDALTPDPTVAALVDRYTALAAPLADRVVGKVTADLTGTQNAAGESALGDVVADAQLEATRGAGAQLALMNPGGIRAPILAGDVTYGEAFTTQPFNNLLVTVSLTGDQLLAVLNQQFAVNRILAPSATLRYRWSTATRTVDPASVTVGGTPLDPAATYRVTVNNFLAGGGDGFSTLTAGTDPFNGVLDIDALVAYLGANNPLSPPPADRITTG